MALNYNPEVFDVADEAAARRIILTPEWGQDTEERWRRETPYLLDLIAERMPPRAGSLVVDYGCGIGRIAKGLIERFDCRVLGVDLSQDMRALAPRYVDSVVFSTVSLPMFRTMVDAGLRVDAAVAIWVLQHSLKPGIDAGLLRDSLKPGGGLFVVNLKGRAVPTREKAWANDGVDVRALLADQFQPVAEGELDDRIVPPQTRELSFWGQYARR